MSFERNIKLLRWHSFFIDFNLWGALAIIYFSKVSGSYTLGLSIFSIQMLSSAAFELPTGFISDKYGRIKTLIFGSLSFLIGAILYAIGSNYWFLVAGAIVQGLGRAFYSGNNDALLYDYLASDNKIDKFEEYNGKIGSMSQIACAISAALSFLIAFFPMSFLLWVSVGSQLICLILGFKLEKVETQNHESGNIFIHIKQALKNFISNFKLRLISLSDIIGFGLSESSYQFRAAFITTLWPSWAIGIASVLSSIGASISFHFSGKILKKISAINILITNFFVSKIINLTSLLFPTILSPVIMTSTSLFYGVGEVSKNKLLQNEFTNSQRATMGSLNSLAGSIFFGFFAILLGMFADNYGPRIALLISTILGFVNLFFYLSFKKIVENESK